MSSLIPETSWANGASGAENVYDTSPAGLGLSPSYLAQASASASAGAVALKDVTNNGTVVDASTRSKLNIIGTNAISDDSANDRVTVKLCDRGTSFPASPNDQDEYVYVADATNGVHWRFKYDSSQTTYKWVCVGATPLYAETAASETTSSATYAALLTAGPAIVLPLAGDYMVTIGYQGANNSDQRGTFMSYDIGGTGALDADSIQFENGTLVNNANNIFAGSRTRRKTGLTAATLTAKYRVDGTTGTFKNRWMEVRPVRVSG